MFGVKKNGQIQAAFNSLQEALEYAKNQSESCKIVDTVKGSVLYEHDPIVGLREFLSE